MKTNIKIIFLVLCSAILGSIFASSAIAVAEETLSNRDISQDVISAYRQFKQVSLPKLLTPKVVEVPLDINSLERSDSLVLDKTTDTFQPSLLIKDKVKESVTASIIATCLPDQSFFAEKMTDNDDQTYTEIPLPDNCRGSVKIILEKASLITADSVYILLDNHVALPKTIAVYTKDGSLKTVLSPIEMTSQKINFPKTSAKNWIIDLSYGQPLRITEIRLGGQYSNEILDSKLRFLAQPGHEYDIYFDSDRRVSATIGEAGNLADNAGVLKLTDGIAKINPGYIIADSDRDSIPDINDNCVSVANLDQIDIDQNGRGDVCDDFDKDGVINYLDNCQDLPNYNQQDNDGDKIGDVCDNEESRLTEKYKWLPWLGIGLAGIIIIGLFVFTVISMRKKPETDSSQFKQDGNS